MKNPVLSALPHNTAAAAEPRLQGGTWRMVAAMLLSGTIGLVVVESGLPVEWVVLLRCLLGALGLGVLDRLQAAGKAGKAVGPKP